MRVDSATSTLGALTRLQGTATLGKAGPDLATGRAPAASSSQQPDPARGARDADRPRAVHATRQADETRETYDVQRVHVTRDVTEVRSLYETRSVFAGRAVREAKVEGDSVLRLSSTLSPAGTGAGVAAPVGPDATVGFAAVQRLDVTINGATRQFETTSPNGAARNAIVGALDDLEGLSTSITPDGRLVFVTDDALQLVIADIAHRLPAAPPSPAGTDAAGLPIGPLADYREAGAVIPSAPPADPTRD